MSEKVTTQAFAIQDPHKCRPNGDRYLVEEIEVENTVYLGEHKLVLPETGNVEEKRGWRLCRIIAAGGGHRLETDVKVPMFFAPGDIVYVERFTGRELVLQARKYWIVNQIDVLMGAPELPDLMALPVAV